MGLFRWFSRWERYVGQGGGDDDRLTDRQASDSQDLAGVPSDLVADRPDLIDNSDLVESGSNSDGDDLELFRTLLEGRDYVLVPQNVWEKLVQW